MNKKKKRFCFYRYDKSKNRKKYFRNELEFLDDLVKKIERDYKKKNPDKDNKNIPFTYIEEKFKILNDTCEIQIQNFIYKVEVY